MFLPFLSSYLARGYAICMLARQLHLTPVAPLLKKARSLFKLKKICNCPNLDV